MSKVDLDSLISVHLSRVKEHRQFLTEAEEVQDPNIVPELSQNLDVNQVAHSPEQLIELHAVTAGKYFTQSPTGVYARSQQWSQIKQRWLREAKAEKKVEEMKDCTFTPRFSRSGNKDDITHSRYQAPSIALHIQRQHDARILKKETDLKLAGGVDVARWTPHQTVPVSFNLGMHRTPVPSLRKPVSGYEASPSPRSDRKLKSADDAEFLPQEKSKRPTSAKSSKTETERQKMEIAELRGTVNVLTRELEVARAKIRELSLRCDK